MAPKLRITAGSRADDLQPVAVNNDDEPFVISSDVFQGRLTVRVKNFHGERPGGGDAASITPYFESGYGQQMTYSIQIQGLYKILIPGRFLEEVNSDNLVFGNQFDKPIRHDLYGDQPWAFSPLLATMYRVSASRAPMGAYEDCSTAQECFGTDAWPPFPAPKENKGFLEDDISPLFLVQQDATQAATKTTSDESSAKDEDETQVGPENNHTDDDDEDEGPEKTEGDDAEGEDEQQNDQDGPAGAKDNTDRATQALVPDLDIDQNTVEKLNQSNNTHAYKQRASWLGSKTHRESLQIKPSDVITADFCNGYVCAYQRLTNSD